MVILVRKTSYVFATPGRVPNQVTGACCFVELAPVEVGDACGGTLEDEVEVDGGGDERAGRAVEMELEDAPLACVGPSDADAADGGAAVDLLADRGRVWADAAAGCVCGGFGFEAGLLREA